MGTSDLACARHRSRLTFAQADLRAAARAMSGGLAPSKAQLSRLSRARAELDEAKARAAECVCGVSETLVSGTPAPGPARSDLVMN
jgi:hypothetical protein